ncbi:MAG: tetratricopeptide repeat protein [Chloroflexota bacterium]
MTVRINSRYVIQNKIGSGGMGVVFRATDRLTRETVALKQVKLSSNLNIKHSLTTGASQDDLRLALAHEFQLLAGLRHPHIISVLDYGFDEERQPFFTMTYLPEAQSILDAAQNESFARKIELIQQLLQALAYLHRRGILHHDLKPDNVIMGDGDLRLLDFGLSSSEQIVGRSSVGTPLYMAPELLEGQEYTRMADLYSVGVLLYQMLTGEHPFAPLDFTFLDRLLDETPDFRRVDSSVRPFLERLLAKIPDERFLTAPDALHALAEALAQPAPKETAAIRESYLQAATFVGRQSEMAQLQNALQQAKDAQGVVCLLGGESGVGKSRLLDEFRTHALVNGWQVLAGQEVAERGTPFQLWQGIVSRLALNTALDDLDAGVLQEIVPSLSTLLEREIPNAPSLSGAEGEQRIVLTVTSLIQQQVRPTLLLLEDLHWSKAGLAPLKQLLKVIEQCAGVMVIGSYRDDEHPHLPDELPGAMLIQLDRLDDAEVAQLSGAMLGEVGAHTDMVSWLTEETEGNTFFIVEVMRALAEDAGQLDEVGPTELPAAMFTSGMEALLQRRINKVDRSDHALMQLAAVAGRQLELSLLRCLMPEVELSSWLQRVSDAAVLTVRDGEWFFSHDKLRQAVLAQLTPAQRKNAHRTVATVIEHLHPDDAQYYPRLLTHWQAAEENNKELHYLLPVVKWMVEISAEYQQGHELASRGLALLPPNDGRRVALLNLRAHAYEGQSNFVDGVSVAKQACVLAKQLNDKIEEANSLKILGMIAFAQSHYRETKDYFEQSLAISQSVQSRWSTAESLRYLGIVAANQGYFDVSTDYFKRSLDLTKTIGDQQGMASCLFNLGVVATEHHNDQAAALDYFQQGIAISQKLGSQINLSKALSSLGILHTTRGEYAKSHEYFQQGLTLRRSMGDRRGIAHIYLVIGESLFFEGADYEQVLHYQEKSLQIYLALNVLIMVGLNYGYMALSHIALGNYEEALQMAVDHFELQATIDLDKSNGLVHVAMAKILTVGRLGQFGGTGYQEKIDRITTLTQLANSPQAYIQESIRVSTTAQIRMAVLIDCGKLALQMGAIDMARLYLEEAQTMAEQIQNQHKLSQIEAIWREMPTSV